MGDNTVSERVATVTWTGGSIAPGVFDTFDMSVSVPDAAGTELKVPTVQTYADGKVTRWIGGPNAAEPAPIVTVTAAEAGAGQSASGTPAPAAAGTGGSGKTNAALGFGIAGLAAGWGRWRWRCFAAETGPSARSETRGRGSTAAPPTLVSRRLACRAPVGLRGTSCSVQKSTDRARPVTNLRRGG